MKEKIQFILVQVSIHAPVWGATAVWETRFHNPLFQSTLPCGERHHHVRDRRERFRVSIHAPVWGATPDYPQEIVSAGFQSTLPCGERRGAAAVLSGAYKFQSTLPCGERRTARKIPRNFFRVSIHAPVWGATMVFSFFAFL